MLDLEWKERAFIEKVNSRCFCWFPAAILVDSFCPPIWRLHTKLYKGAWNVSATNSETVGHKDLRFGQIVYILVFYNIHFLGFFHWTVSNLFFLLRDSENDLLRNQTERSTGFVPFFEQKIQGLFKDPSYFSRISTKKSLESTSFLVLLQHEQLYREGLSVFAPLGTWESGLD